MKRIFGLNFFVFCIIVLFVVLYFSKEVRQEGFYDKSCADECNNDLTCLAKCKVADKLKP